MAAAAGGPRYGGFESGIRHSHGKPKRAYRGFRLPLAARRSGRRGVYLWGLVRPARGRTRVKVKYRNRHSRTWRRLKTDATTSRGYWSTTTRRRAGRRYRVRWGRYLGARRGLVARCGQLLAPAPGRPAAQASSSA